jgi:hypothetical protein
MFALSALYIHLLVLLERRTDTRTARSPFAAGAMPNFAAGAMPNFAAHADAVVLSNEDQWERRAAILKLIELRLSLLAQRLEP